MGVHAQFGGSVLLSARSANLPYLWCKQMNGTTQLGVNANWAILLRIDQSADFWPIWLLFFSNGTSIYIVVNDPKPIKLPQLKVTANWRDNYWTKNDGKHIKRTGVTRRTILLQNCRRTMYVYDAKSGPEKVHFCHFEMSCRTLVLYVLFL